ncbi:MAG: papain-like cysteine protease family protein [Planctomycetota bacterium]
MNWYSALKQSPPQPTCRRIGLPSDAIDLCYAKQQEPLWCWAACIEMILRIHGFAMVTQDSIVRVLYPSSSVSYAPNVPANYRQMTQLLNSKLGSGREGWANFHSGVPSLKLLYHQITRGCPVILLYTPPGATIGHAVLLTAVDVCKTPTGLKIVQLIFRDRQPNAPHDGKMLGVGRDFAKTITGYITFRTISSNSLVAAIRHLVDLFN